MRTWDVVGSLTFALGQYAKFEAAKLYLLTLGSGFTEEAYRQRLAELRREFGPEHAAGCALAGAS